MIQVLLAQYDAIALTGPTAGGKSALAMQLAQHVPLEIISMDSAQVYAGMNVGTAKPSAGELAAVAHHLINILDPAQAYNAAEFARDALHLIPQIRARQRLPLIVGGTMLYFKALTEGLSDLPVADQAVRAQIEAEAAECGWPAMHAQLQALDPHTAQRLAPNDRQRIGRALEVIRVSGTPMSAHLARAPVAASPRILHLSVEPERETRWQRIETRFDAMLAQGLIDEVRALKARGDLHAQLPAMRSVGYRQAWEHLEGQFNLAEMRERGIAATRQLAKRQMTWLRSMPKRQLVDDLNGLLGVLKDQ
jgi:tRNA dimethylallyltransferase